MRKQIVNSRLLHYALLALSLSVATVGGLVLLGCGPEQMADVTVADPAVRNPNGGVLFHRSENTTQTMVTLPATVEEQPVTWTMYGASELGQIPDPNKSNELQINMPDTGVGFSSVHLKGTYTTSKGVPREVYVYVPVRTEN